MEKILAGILIILMVSGSCQAALSKVCPGKPADIVFIMDESSSIWPVHFARQREFLANLTESFDVGPDQTRISVVTFADKVTLRFGLADYKKNEDVSNAIAKIDQKTGGTRTDKVLQFVRHKVFSAARPGVPKIAVLITDGASWYPRLTALQARLLQEHNVTIFAVAVSNKINWSEIELIASDPDEMHVFSVESFDDLGELLVDQLVASTCKVQGNPVGVCDVSFKSDVAFVLASASENPYGALLGMNMIQSIIADENTFVGPDSLRFAMLPKTCQLDLGFDLDTYKTKPEIDEHIEDAKEDFTMASDHIDALTTHVFTPENGDRPDVRNLAVIIMDRRSPNPHKTIAAAQRAKDAGIEVIVVAVGKEVDDAEITQIASGPIAGHKITISDYTDTWGLWGPEGSQEWSDVVKSLQT